MAHKYVFFNVFCVTVKFSIAFVIDITAHTCGVFPLVDSTVVIVTIRCSQ